MNLFTNLLSVENIEEELITPSRMRLRDDKSKPLIVQEFIRLWHKQGASKQSCCLLSHRDKQVALSQNVVEWNLTCEILLLVTSVTVSTGLMEVPRGQKDIITLSTKELTFKRITMFDITKT